MRKKSLAISNIVMLVAAVFCVAIFGAGAVWAYNANLAMKFQATFSFNALTLNLNGAKIYENGEIQNSNFTIIPVAENTLKISAEYQNFGFNVNNETQSKSVEFIAIKSENENYSISLVKVVAYDVVIYDSAKSINRTDCITFSNGTITLLDAVAAESGDIITFQISFSK